ncbi:PAS domain S-box protein [Halorhodospira abdelmalekii]|uniref:PAS domain S-box protein n=1 Tax=Halorhodospira abdelmalekii TaxID=421629 RepID=UPI00190820EA|nr:PAS domain S-box protein [Halorhodospira abdelmalekii]
MGNDRMGQRTFDFLQKLLNSSPGALCTLDPAGRFTYLNAAACQLLGYPDEAALLGIEFATVVDADRTSLEAAAVTEQLLAVATTGEPLCGDTTVWLQPRVGAAFPVAMEAAVLLSGETAADDVVITFRDCTAQYELEAELKQRELEFAEIQRLAQIGSWSWDLRTGYSKSSAEACRIFGTTTAAVDHTKAGFLAFVHPDDRTAVEAELEEIIDQQREQWESEFRIVRSDGEIRTVYERGQIEFDHTGQPQRFSCMVQDVTEQRARDRFQQRLIAILDSTPDLVSLHDTDGNLIYSNEAGRVRFALPQLPHLGEAVADADHRLPPYSSVEEAIRRCHPPWAAELLLNEGLPTARCEGIWQGETTFLDADGREIPASQVIIGHRDTSGKVAQLSTIIRDISDIKRAQQEVAESEQRFRLIAAHVHDAFWLRTEERTLYVNPAYERIWGLSLESLYANPNSFLEAIHPADREAVESAVHQAIAACEEINIRYRVVRPDDDVRWVEARSSPFTVSGTAEVLRAGVARDITNEAVAMTRLEQLVAILDNTSDIVALHGEDGELLYLNAAGKANVGIDDPTLDSVLGGADGGSMPPLSVEEAIRRFHPPWAAELLLNEGLPTARCEGLWQGETAIIGADGRYIPTSQVLIVHRNAAGEIAYISTILRDISERQEALAQLRLANRAKTDFLNAVSHDLRTPLNAIIGFTDLLAESPLDATQRRQIELCQAAGCTLLGLIDTLLDLSRLEAGRLVLQREPFEFRAFLAEQLAIVARQAEEKGLQLEWLVDADVPEQLFGDTTRFGQVLFNLIVNAIKFTERGYVRVRFSRYSEGLLQVAVEDSGPGITIELQQRIFEPFERGNVQANRQQGAGLGLAISRELVRLMGGTLWLRSIPGEGSTFFFTAALLSKGGGVTAERSETDCRCSPAAEEQPIIVGMRVLVAEDDPTNTLLIRALLERCGAQPTVAEHGQAALEIWQQAEETFDLILLDMQMPILDGAQTARALRTAEAEQGWPHTPIAMLSAHATAEVREQCLQSGADTYMTKPIRLDALVELLCWARQMQ